MPTTNFFDRYYDQMGAYTAYANRRHINAVAPKVKVYLLDRTGGPSDTIYNEELNKIYLPYFYMRGFYLTQRWTQPLGTNAISEPEDETVNITFNLDDMVKTLRLLKNVHNSDLYISYTGSHGASIEKESGILTVKEQCAVLAEYTTANYSLEELTTAIHGLTNFSATSDGDMKESADNLVEFPLTQIIVGDQLNIYTLDGKFTNIADFIQIGDLIISHHNILYEVTDAMVRNLRFYEWPCFLIKGEKRQLSDNVKLPGHGLDEIYTDHM